jgi:ADP-ribose pyrophosphatase
MASGHALLETPWFTVRAVPLDGDETPYYVIDVPDCVVVLPRTPDGALLLVRQYRPPLGDWVLEFPAGYVDPGETPERAARRELREETGCGCDRLLSLGTLNLFASRLDYTLHLFVAEVGPPGDAPAEPGVECLRVRPDELEAMIADGRFRMATCIAQYFMAKARGMLASAPENRP